MLVVNVNTVALEGRFIPQGQGEAGDHVVSHGKEMRVTMQDSPYIVATDTVVSPLGVPCTKPPWGKLIGIDMSKGEIVWQSPLGSIHELGPVNLPFEINWGTPNLGGAIATGGGLTFIGSTMDRRFRAFNTRTGEYLWSTKVPNDATASPMTYSINGRQYVVIAAGGHKIFAQGVGDHLMAYALPQQ
jgi:quinoprotein glucose dehydrogenase